MTEHQVSDYVADKIRTARKLRDWTTSDLASRCGLTDNIIENIEAGRRDRDGHRRRGITLDELYAIAEAFGAEPLDFMPGKMALLSPSRREELLAAAEAERAQAEVRLGELTRQMETIAAMRAEADHEVSRVHMLIEQMRR